MKYCEFLVVIEKEPYLRHSCTGDVVTTIADGNNRLIGLPTTMSFSSPKRYFPFGNFTTIAVAFLSSMI